MLQASTGWTFSRLRIESERHKVYVPARARARIYRRKSIALVTRETLLSQVEKFDIKFPHLAGNFSEREVKCVRGRSAAVSSQARFELRTRIIIFLRPERECTEGQATMPKLYGYKSRQKRTRTGSVTCPPLSGVSKNVGPRRTVGWKGSEETDVRTSERANGRTV